MSVAASAAAASQVQTQQALAAKFAKANASSEQSIVQLIESSSANLEQVVKSAPASGLGANLDISA